MKKLFFTLVLAGIVFTSSFAQIAKFKAMYIYNFSRLVEWPEEYRNGDFVIGLIGNTDVEDEIVPFVQNKKAGSQSIAVKKYSDANSIEKCNILFVSSSASKNFDEIISNLKGKNTLVITDNGDLLNQGAVISFVVKEGKLKYFYNDTNAQKYGLKVSTSLANMALANN